MIDLPNLTAKKELEELVYHFKGFLEAADTIRDQMEILDRTIDTDLESATSAISLLSMEIYTLLTYHLKELRRPFLRLSRSLYRELGNDDELDVDDELPETSSSS